VAQIRTTAGTRSLISDQKEGSSRGEAFPFFKKKASDEWEIGRGVDHNPFKRSRELWLIPSIQPIREQRKRRGGKGRGGSSGESTRKEALGGIKREGGGSLFKMRRFSIDIDRKEERSLCRGNFEREK